MEYLLNWMVLILSLGGIGLVAWACYHDLSRPRSETSPGVHPANEISHEPYVAPVHATGPRLELSYVRDGSIAHSQWVNAGDTGYIGTESYPGLGAGMPVRYVEIRSAGDGFSCCNLDWQSPMSLRSGAGGELDAAPGQRVGVADGDELILADGWTIRCRIEGDEPL